MALRIDLERLNKMLEVREVPEEIRHAVLKEIQLLTEVPWLTPKIVLSPQEIRKLSFETLRNFRIQDPKTQKFAYQPHTFLLGTIDNWNSLAKMQRSITWAKKRDDVGSLISNVIRSKGREKARTAITVNLSNSLKQTVSGAVEDALTAAAQTLQKLTSSAVEIKSSSIVEMAAQDALSTTLGYLSWILVSDGIKGGALSENPFEPMLGLWKLGLWPLGIARYEKEVRFWIGVPPGVEGALPRFA